MQTEAHSSAGQMVSMTPPTSEDLRTPETLRQENRTLRWKAKQLGKQLGRQGREAGREGAGVMWFVAGFVAGTAALAGAVCFRLYRLGKELVGP